jgi:hypothetical protein
MYWSASGELVGFGIDETAEFAQRRLFALSESRFTTFSLQADANVILNFLRDDQSATALQIPQGKDAYITAQRQESGCR